ncbi:MAG: hypothetical protein PHU12_03665 [Candidatus Aenigmarchaeota archaeon]|nr:hypothetical protein [Candidatus Aenigmarchaeota archaeon]
MRKSIKKAVETRDLVKAYVEELTSKEGLVTAFHVNRKFPEVSVGSAALLLKFNYEDWKLDYGSMTVVESGYSTGTSIRVYFKGGKQPEEKYFDKDSLKPVER